MLRTTTTRPRFEARQNGIAGPAAATAGMVVGGGVVRAIPSGAEPPAPRRAAIFDALASVHPGAAACLVAAEHLPSRTVPVVRIVRQLRPGWGTAREAVAVLLSSFQGRPVPTSRPVATRPPARPTPPPELAPGTPAWLPPYLRPRATSPARITRCLPLPGRDTARAGRVHGPAESAPVASGAEAGRTEPKPAERSGGAPAWTGGLAADMAGGRGGTGCRADGRPRWGARHVRRAPHSAASRISVAQARCGD